MAQTAFYITLTSAFKDFLCSFAERTTDAGKAFFKPATKKRKLSTTDAFTKSTRRWRHLFPINKLLIGVFWPQRRLVKDEEKKGRKKGGRKTKVFCWNWYRYFENKKNAFSTISFALVPSAGLVFGFIYAVSWKMFYEV